MATTPTLPTDAQIRIIIALRGLKQRELSRRARINEARISQICRGWLRPSPSQLERIKEALNWPPNAEEAFAILASDNNKPQGAQDVLP